MITRNKIDGEKNARINLNLGTNPQDAFKETN